MQNRIWIVTLLTIIGLFFGSKSTLAVETPNFPLCSNPQGNIISPTSSGAHGIPGDTSERVGNDTVYAVDDTNTLMQCFCSTNGQGVQTNWWKISSLDGEQLQILKNDGWIYVPNGALWGLQKTPYMAKNSNYACGGNNSNNNGGGPGGGDGRSDGLGCGSHDCSGNAASAPQGSVLGISTSIGEVLGLASTGGSFLPYVLGIVGALSLATGVFLSKKTSRR